MHTVKLLVVAVVAGVMLLITAVPALADHSPVHSVQQVREFILPPGYTHESEVWVYETGGFGDAVGLYGLMGFCRNYGGYWYYEDGYHWHPCSYEPGDLPAIED